MGNVCKAKDSAKSVITSETERFDKLQTTMSDAQYKAKLEQKLCLFKETPEPVCDLSECNIEKLPSLFPTLKVLRKEILILKQNRLKSLSSGGVLYDLELLQVLDISHNKFKVIPVDICVLTNLRELFMSNNLLTQLPSTINRLRRLELLDVSNNDLTDLRVISFMPELRILNVSGNKSLTILPPELAMCENLHDLVFDEDVICNPSRDILATGTINILKYLSTGELTASSVDYGNEDELMKMSKVTKSRLIGDNMDSTKKFLEKERKIFVQEGNFEESEVHKEQQKKKGEMLKSLVEQQKNSENAVNKMQNLKDAERRKLIEDIMKFEVSSNLVVNELLALKKGPDPALLELEDKTRDALLEKVHLEQSELRKKEVLAAMSQTLELEFNLIQNYNDGKTDQTKNMLESETKTNLLLNDMFQNYDKSRTEIIERVHCDESWQKSAVAALIAKNDARSWGLMEQIKIVESQIAAMTNLEIDKKKVNQDEFLNDVAEKRCNLTMVLLDLMEQQDKRKNELRQTLLDMENQKTDDDFWLIQYQKLLDSRGVMQSAQATLDTELGYNLLLHGVVHVIPFLMKIWNKKDFSLENIKDDDLLNAGVRKAEDRQGVLKAIRDYLDAQDSRQNVKVKQFEIEQAEEALPGPSKPSAPQDDSPTATTSASNDDAINNSSECVVCMDEPTKVIFLPCGHLCCCISCSNDLADCPMCRASIERKIRIIQS